MSDLEDKTAFSGECMLAGWSESHTGGAKITLWLADHEQLDAFRAMTIKKGNVAGQRLMVAMVEIGDDEQPKAPVSMLGPLCSEAVSFCARKEFQAWITDDTQFALTAAGARQALYAMLRISSRRDLDADPEAGKRWKALKAEYYQANPLLKD